MNRFAKKNLFLVILFFITILPLASFAGTISAPVVSQQLFLQAKKNENWKIAFLTAKNEQIVFMNITPSTNPKNEIGIEKHTFDQVIYVVEGHAKVDLNGKISMANPGDIVFIPAETVHNVINLDKNKPLKIVSFYSSNDIPASATYKTKADEPQE